MRLMKVRILILLITFCFVGELQAQELIKPLHGNWKFSLGDDMEWASADFDDSLWDNIYAPSAWENEGFNGYDGYAWYRRVVNGDQLKDYYNLQLNLGYIDDSDQVFFNGVLIGYSGTFPPNFNTAYNAKRAYHIPNELIRDGENVIAIRVYDTVLGGGIISGEIGIYTASDIGFPALTLEGLWKFREGDEAAWKNPGYDDEEWPFLMAPGYWRNIGKKNFESFGWYRKEFMMPSWLNGKGLTLILGVIDDFDEVYLNGQFIGRTNDGERWGHSESYRQLRIYPIPEGLINESGKNTLAVRITDLGGEAGIYKGPLMILDSQDAAVFVRDFLR